jgi:hypothetical protein
VPSGIASPPVVYRRLLRRGLLLEVGRICDFRSLFRVVRLCSVIGSVSFRAVVLRSVTTRNLGIIDGKF